MTAAAAYGCTAVAVIVAGFGAYAASILAGHERVACLRRAAAVRTARALLAAAVPAAWAAGRIRAAARRARHGHVPGLPGDGKGCLSDDEFLASLIIELRWDRTAPEPERAP
jgi:hypothetical protein